MTKTIASYRIPVYDSDSWTSETAQGVEVTAGSDLKLAVTVRSRSDIDDGGGRYTDHRTCIIATDADGNYLGTLAEFRGPYKPHLNPADGTRDLVAAMLPSLYDRARALFPAHLFATAD